MNFQDSLREPLTTLIFNAVSISPCRTSSVLQVLPILEEITCWEKKNGIMLRENTGYCMHMHIGHAQHHCWKSHAGWRISQSHWLWERECRALTAVRAVNSMGDWHMGRGCSENKSTHSPWLGDACPMGFSLCNSHMANTAHKQIMLQSGNLHRAMEQEKPSSAGWQADTSCNSKGVEGGGELRESLSASKLAGLYTAQPYLPCSSSFLDINVTLHLAKLP